MAGFMMAKDAISGQEGRATANINGRVINLFYLKDIEATVAKNKKGFRALGKRGEQQKAAGYSGTGSMTIYYVTSEFRKLMLDYAKNGRDTYFDITITNEDPTSSVGRQTTVLHGVNLDEIVVAKLNVEEEFLEEDVSFTFSDFNILDEFNEPII